MATSDTSPTPSSTLPTALAAARAAGAVARARLGAHGVVSVKGFRDIVTEADVAAQAAAERVIRAAFPQAAILGEESSAAQQAAAWEADELWVVDPIDGTTNFARGLPIFSVAIGVCRAGVPEVGVVYDPLRDQTFYAARGTGAFARIGEGPALPMHVSDAATLSGAIGGVDWARVPEVRKQAIEYMSRLAPVCRTVRALGSAALGIVYVAAGWLDVYYHLSLAPWDAAASVAILREAGGRATLLPEAPGAAAEDWDLRAVRLLASNGAVHGEALRVLLGSDPT